MRRAIELDNARDAEISEQELIDIARELGISSMAVSQALRELKAGEPERIDPLSLYEAAKTIEASARRPGWMRRTVGTGLLMALGVGIPVGLLLAFTTPLADLPPGGRAGAVLLFVGVSALWTIPFSFGARWLSLRSLNKHRLSERALRNSPGPHG